MGKRGRQRGFFSFISCFAIKSRSSKASKHAPVAAGWPGMDTQDFPVANFISSSRRNSVMILQLSPLDEALGHPSLLYGPEQQPMPASMLSLEMVIADFHSVIQADMCKIPPNASVAINITNPQREESLPEDRIQMAAECLEILAQHLMYPQEKEKHKDRLKLLMNQMKGSRHSPTLLIPQIILPELDADQPEREEDQEESLDPGKRNRSHSLVLEKIKNAGKMYKYTVDDLQSDIDSIWSSCRTYADFQQKVLEIVQPTATDDPWRAVSLLHYITSKLIRKVSHTSRVEDAFSTSSSSSVFQSNPNSLHSSPAPLAIPEDIDPPDAVVRAVREDCTAPTTPEARIQQWESFSMTFFREFLAERVQAAGGFKSLLVHSVYSEVD